MLCFACQLRISGRALKEMDLNMKMNVVQHLMRLIQIEPEGVKGVRGGTNCNFWFLNTIEVTCAFSFPLLSYHSLTVSLERDHKMPLPAISIIERKQDVSSPRSVAPFFLAKLFAALSLLSFLGLRWMKCLTTLSIFINVATRGQASIVWLSFCLSEGPFAILASLCGAVRRPLCHIFLALSRWRRRRRPFAFFFFEGRQ